MMSTRAWCAWLTIAVAGCNGAGSSPSGEETETEAGTEAGSTDDAPSLPCVPGQQVGCACLGGGDVGVQVCNAEGSGFGACECPDTTASPTSDDDDDETTDDESSTGDALGETTDDESSTGDAPAECGDGTCDAEESEATCCADCGCAEGSSCIEDVCVVDPYCGDARCNGAETVDDCCADCGCGEEGYACMDNACACAEASFHFENVLPDTDEFCFATNSFYTQTSTAYYNNNAGSGWIELSAGEFVEFPGEIGDSYNGMQQCCYLDPCLGNLMCPTANGNYPCICTDPQQVGSTITTCGENFFAVCG